MISLDKEIGGISKMIELSSTAMIDNVKKIYLFLPKDSSTYIHIKSIFEENNKVEVISISDKEKFLFKVGMVSKGIKEKVKLSNIIFLHNADLGKSFKKNFNNKPVVLFFHTDKFKQIKMMKYFDVVFAVNKTTTNSINNYFGITKAHYLPNCIDKIDKNFFLKRKKKDKKFTIGGMGRLVDKKGFENLIKVCMEIPDIKLLIAGDGPLMKKYIKLVKGHKNIKLLGWIKNKNDFFNEIDVFCSISKIEPFGIVILEAMARGIPVICSKCNGPKDIIRSGYNGMLIEDDNLAKLAKDLNELKKNKNMLNKFSKNGLQEVKNRYTLKSYRRNLLDFLDGNKIIC